MYGLENMYGLAKDVRTKLFFGYKRDKKFDEIDEQINSFFESNPNYTVLDIKLGTSVANQTYGALQLITTLVVYKIN